MTFDVNEVPVNNTGVHPLDCWCEVCDALDVSVDTAVGWWMDSLNA